MATRAVVGAAFAGAALFGSAVYSAQSEKDLGTQNLPELRRTRKKISFEEATRRAEDLCQQVKDESGSPGLVVSVTVDGVNVFSKGYGYSDIENRLPCNSKTVMRIASISKSITMTAVAKLWQEGSLSLDKPVQEYVPQFPVKLFDHEEVPITTRHLISHLSGIRHYDKKPAEKEGDVPVQKNDTQENKKKEEFENKEYHIKDYYDDMSKSLNIFQNDELFFKPGTKFLYTTHGWTLISAVVESIVKKPFTTYIKTIFDELGLKNTYLDLNQPLIYNRARYYIRNDKGRLENAPYVDNSYKWAGGGFLSTVEDLVQFGNALLYSYQRDGGYLEKETVEMIWKPVDLTRMPWDQDGAYGMGWGVVPNQANYPFCKHRKFYVSHTGGAIGASSVLLILPNDWKENGNSSVSGVVVAMIVNLQSVGLNKTALQIAELFDEALS